MSVAKECSITLEQWALEPPFQGSGHGFVEMRLGGFEPYAVTISSQLSDCEDLCSRKDFSKDNRWTILLKQDGPYRISTKSKNDVGSGL